MWVQEEKWRGAVSSSLVFLIIIVPQVKIIKGFCFILFCVITYFYFYLVYAFFNFNIISTITLEIMSLTTIM